MHGANTHAGNAKKGTRYCREGFVYLQPRAILYLPRIATSSLLHPESFQASLPAQPTPPTPLGESLGRSTQRDSKTSQYCYGHPGATSTLSASSGSVFPCRCSDAFSSSLHPRGHKPTAPFPYFAVSNLSVLCGGTPVPRDAKHPTIICHAARPFFLLSPLPPPPAHIFPRFPALPIWPSWVTCCRPWGAAPPTTTAFSCPRLFRYSHIWFAGGRLCRRGCGFLATCTRLLGFGATSCDVLFRACCSGP